MNIGFGEILLILLVILILFGAKRLPEIGRALGKAYSEFKKGLTGEKADKEKTDNEKKKK